MNVFHDRVMALTREHGLTQLALSNILDVSSNSITNWSKGKEPRISTIIKASQYFHVSTDYLLGLSNKCNYNEPEEPLKQKELELICRIKGRFSNAQLCSIMKVIDGMEHFEEAGKI